MPSPVPMSAGTASSACWASRSAAAPALESTAADRPRGRADALAPSTDEEMIGACSVNGYCG